MLSTADNSLLQKYVKTGKKLRSCEFLVKNWISSDISH